MAGIYALSQALLPYGALPKGGFFDCTITKKVRPRLGSHFFGAGVLLRCPVCALPTVRLRCTPTAATRFVKAQATMLHFPQAENSSCALAFPLPTKQALRGPQVALPPAAQGCLGQTLTCGSSPTGKAKKQIPQGVSAFLVQRSNPNPNHLSKWLPLHRLVLWCVCHP